MTTRAAGRGEAVEPPVVFYRCVCGTTVELDPAAGGRCSGCGRRYASDVVRLAAGETIRMPAVEPDDAPAAPPGDDTRPETAGRPSAIDAESPTTRLDTAAEDPARPAASLPADRRLGHFRVIGPIGRGGMGDVYRALDESLQRYVAIKVLRPGAGGAPDGGAAEKLLQEARAQARVNHPGVVHIYYVSPDPARPFLAMELVPGPRLADRMSAGPVPYAETVDVAVQIARALRHAAKFDVVHGDIKPGNILLAGDGLVKLSDFGLARRLSGGPGRSPGPITGTPHYLPPEALAGTAPDLRGDQYALGVMLFEMTFGRRPYTVESGKLLDEIEAHRSAVPEFPDPWPADLPLEWRDLLARLLAKDPADRYVDYDALLADLERLRPVDLPRAGRINRGMAWLVDLFLDSALRGLVLLPFAFPSGRDWLADRPLLRFALPVVSVLAPLGASWLQAAWRTSPGKVLFQLRIVDRHGLAPGPAALALRAVFQMLPVWGTAVGGVFIHGLHAEVLGAVIAAVALLACFADAAVGFVRCDGRAFHDLLLRTRVALDTRIEGIRAADRLHAEGLRRGSSSDPGR